VEDIENKLRWLWLLPGNFKILFAFGIKGCRCYRRYL